MAAVVLTLVATTGQASATDTGPADAPAVETSAPATEEATDNATDETPAEASTSETPSDSTGAPGSTAPADATPDPAPEDPEPDVPADDDVPIDDTWTAATPSVFGLGDSLFMQCGSTLGLGARSTGMVGWPSATTQDLRVRMSSAVAAWPWMTESSHAEELRDFRDASTWVIGLGTNDVSKLSAAQFEANVQWFLEQAGGRPVLWFTVHQPRMAATAAAFNGILSRAAQESPNLRLLDWNASVAADRGLLAYDGIHLADYDACRRGRFALIQAAVPPVRGESPSPTWVDPAPVPPPSPNPVTTAYEQAGGSLGAPVSPLTCERKEDGCAQFFERGAIAWSPGTGVHVLPPAAADAWRNFAETGGPGYPTGDAQCGLSGGGCRQAFQTGWLYWTATTPAFHLTGPILDRYLAAGGPRGLGYPTSASPCGLSGVGCSQHFGGGSLYWSATTGTRLLTGAVRSRYVALGGERSSLGYPTIDTACTTAGCGQHFTGGSIYSSTRTGTRLITGAIRTRWIAAGGPRSGLGYPTIDTACTATGCGQHFTGGSIYSSTRTGTRLITGAIRTRWIAAGGPRGFGYPTAEAAVIRSTGGVSQRFERGTLVHHPGR